MIFVFENLKSFLSAFIVFIRYQIKNKIVIPHFAFRFQLSYANPITNFFCCCSAVIHPAKIISLVSQKESSDIIATTDSIKRGKETYQRWHKKFTANSEKIFELPTLKSVLDKIDEENHTYQGVQIKIFIERNNTFRTGHPR